MNTKSRDEYLNAVRYFYPNLAATELTFGKEDRFGYVLRSNGERVCEKPEYKDDFVKYMKFDDTRHLFDLMNDTEACDYQMKEMVKPYRFATRTEMRQIINDARKLCNAPFLVTDYCKIAVMAVAEHMALLKSLRFRHDVSDVYYLDSQRGSW